MTGGRTILLGAIAAGLAVIMWHDMFGASAPTSTPPAASSAVDNPVAAPSRPIADRKAVGSAGKRTPDAADPSVTLSGLLRLEPGQFADIVARPLFSTTRRPPAPKPRPIPKPVVIKKPPPPREPPLRAQLVGIVKGNGRRIALLRETGSNKTQKLSTGDTIQSWEIEAIGDATVRMRHKKWSKELTLFRP